MLGRYGGRTGLHRVAAAAALSASLIAPAALSAQEAEQSAPPPAVEQAQAAPPAAQPAAEPEDPAPAPAPAEAPTPAAATPAASPPAPPSVQVTPETVSRASASAAKSVSIVDFAYSPAALTVNTGDRVTWTNKDAAPEGHDVTGDGLDSGLMNQGDTYSFSFEEAGNYSYICSIHPSMTGTVEVLARADGSGGSGGGGSSGESSGVDTSGSVTESEAIASPDAAGTATTLPASGEAVAAMAGVSFLLLALGLALRVLPAVRARS